jgi:hypothetical protein
MTRYEIFGLMGFLDLVCATRVALDQRRRARGARYFAVSFLQLVVGYLGGTGTVSLLLSDSPGWVRWNGTLLAVGAVWYVLVRVSGALRFCAQVFVAFVLAMRRWLTYACPWDLWVRVYENVWVQRAVVIVESVNVAFSVVILGVWRALHIGTTAASLNMKHTDETQLTASTAGALLCGVLAGTGGGLLVESMNLLHRPLSEVVAPNMGASRYRGHVLVVAIVSVLVLDPRVAPTAAASLASQPYSLVAMLAIAVGFVREVVPATWTDSAGHAVLGLLGIPFMILPEEGDNGVREGSVSVATSKSKGD